MPANGNNISLALFYKLQSPIHSKSNFVFNNKIKNIQSDPITSNSFLLAHSSRPIDKIYFPKYT